MLRVIQAILVLSSFACFVSAGIYGTSPTASTVWSAGRSESISWIDDSSAPQLDDLSDIVVELFGGDDDQKPVALLAEGVKPTTKSLSVWISPSWGHNGSDYYIRFTCRDPPVEVYTASFTILDMSTIPALTPGPSSVQENQTTYDPGAGFYTPYLTLVLPNTTIVSALSPRPTSPRPTSTSPPIRKQEEHGGLTAQTGDAGQRVDIERLKFRLVFILWPALVGITMAL